MVTVQDNAITADFRQNGDGEAVISFNDPSYIRAEIILYDADNGSVHAVFHESTHFIGRLPEALGDSFLGTEEIILVAPHHDGDIISFIAPLSVTARQ